MVISRLRLFGAPVLECAGETILFRRRKVMALLAYLGVIRGHHHREALAAMLWPESGSVQANAALRNLLWMLRTTPIADLVKSDRTLVRLQESDLLAVDVNQFRDLVRDCPAQSHSLDAVCAECEPRLAEAVALWGAPFMSGYTSVNSAPFEDWQFAEGEALKRELTETLERLTRYYFSIERWQPAATCARKWIETDSLNERAYRRLMQVLLATDKRSEALQVYAKCMRVLSDELGLKPDQATVDLAARVRDSTSGAVSRTLRPASRLPRATSPLIGRREIEEKVEGLLKDGRARVVSLIGPGGAGKTSLALHVGRHIESCFADGAAYVPLDSRHDRISVASAVGRALDLALIGEVGEDLNQGLAAAVRDRELLVILDGAERLLSQVSALTYALESATGVRILVTSHVEMGSANELVIPLRGVRYPETNLPIEEIADCAAIRLLHAAAERHGCAVEMDGAELSSMGRIATLLEGLPLGLEMAAGWRSVLTWDAIADRVRENLEFLVHRRRDVSPRHRTMAAVFEQSWDLLPNDARTVLRRLSVFRGTFTIRAAEEVAGGAPSSFAVLVNRGLLNRTGTDRYRMHELLRQFAGSKLTSECRDAQRTYERYLDYYAAAADRWSIDLKGPKQLDVLANVESEIENLQHALQSSAQTGATGPLRSLSSCLYTYYDMRTFVTEGETVFTSALESSREHDDRDDCVVAFLCIASAHLGVFERPEWAAQRRAEGMAMLPDAEPSDQLHALANVIYAAASFGSERLENRERLQGSIAFYQAEGDLHGEALALCVWAQEERFHDVDFSEVVAQKSLRLFRGLEDKCGESVVLHYLAYAAEVRGNLELSLKLNQRARSLNEPFTRGAFGVIASIIAQARVEAKLGNANRSMQLAEEALHLGREGGYRYQVGRALIECARAARLLGDHASAKGCLEEAFGLLGHWRDSRPQTACVAMLVEVALDALDASAAALWLRELEMLNVDDDISEGLRLKLDELRASSDTKHGLT